MRRLTLAALLCGCASQGAPPGGPVDVTAPKILSITPDTGQTGVKLGQVVFKFDEVVDEHPPGTTTLEDLFLISPRQGSPDVSWSRRELRVKPKVGWRANTTYTVTLLPGLADLRHNARNTSASTFFSTGPTLAHGRVSGVVIDFATAAPVRGAIVEARAANDSTFAWISTTDSAGAYVLGHMPSQQYSLKGYLDSNHNFALDPGEPWDSTSIALTDSGTAQLLLFVRDSVAPSLDQISARDSVTLLVSFDRLADSVSATNPANYTVKAPDSTLLPVLAVKPTPRDTSAHQIPMPRPHPLRSVFLTLGRPLLLKTAYRVRAAGVLGLGGKSVASEKVVTLSRFTPITTPTRTLPRNLPGGAVPIPPQR